MEIDVTAPEGNIFTALGIATTFMRQAHRSKEDIEQLRKTVMAAKNYGDACEAITDATFGSIVFVNSNE